MELLKHNTDTNVGGNQQPEVVGLWRSVRITQANLLQRQDQPPFSYNSLIKLIPSVNKKKRTPQGKTGRFGPQKPNKQAGSKKTERITKRAEDKNSGNSLAWSLMMESVKEADLGRANGEAAIEKAHKDPNSSGCSRENESGQQQTFENPDTQSTQIQLGITQENAEMLVENSNSPSNPIPSGEVDVKPSPAVLDYKNFIIIFNGIDITSAIEPERTRISYFNLCRAHNSILHKGLIYGINVNHAIFIISETAKISSAIRSCDMHTSEKEIVSWSKVLESFSTLGMDVGLIFARVKRLLDLKTYEKVTVDRKKDEETRAKEEKLEEKIRAFESEIEKMREEKKKIKEEREVIKKKAEEIEAHFLLEASAPW